MKLKDIKKVLPDGFEYQPVSFNPNHFIKQIEKITAGDYEISGG